MAFKLHPSFHAHPGPWLYRNAVKPCGYNGVKTAQHLGVGNATISKIFNGKMPLSPDLALRFEQAFGIPAEILLRMQAAHDLELARAALKVKIKRIPEKNNAPL